MRIAVSSQGNDPGSQVDPRFGRAAFFIIYDTETGAYETLNNSANVQAVQGAGVRSAESIADRQIDVVVSGNIGPKAFDTLSAAGIKAVMCGGGTVSEAIEMVRNNKLEAADGANVEGHWK